MIDDLGIAGIDLKQQDKILFGQKVIIAPPSSGHADNGLMSFSTMALQLLDIPPGIRYCQAYLERD